MSFGLIGMQTRTAPVRERLDLEKGVRDERFGKGVRDERFAIRDVRGSFFLVPLCAWCKFDCSQADRETETETETGEKICFSKHQSLEDRCTAHRQL